MVEDCDSTAILKDAEHMCTSITYRRRINTQDWKVSGECAERVKENVDKTRKDLPKKA